MRKAGMGRRGAGEPKFHQGVDIPGKLQPGPLRMILESNRNVWKVAPAKRASVLLDGADYFAAVRRAMSKAQRSILIAGWDIHSQTRLVGAAREPDDGYPPLFAAFL